MFTALFAVLAAGLFHLASPLAVSAQSSARMRVTVTVMPGEGIWAAQRLSQGLVEELAGQLEEEVGRNAPSAAPAASAKAAPGFRREASGAVAWVEPLDGAVQPRPSVADRTDPGDGGTGHDPVARITVAHLAS